MAKEIVAQHGYGEAAATRTLRTEYGTFHVCGDCVASGHLQGHFTADLPLASENTRQRCQCEHADHFTEGGAR